MAESDATPGFDGLPTTLILVRHGRTPHTAARLLSGRGSDPGLSPDGEQDAQRAADSLARLGTPESPYGTSTVDAVESSPNLRARQTCQKILAQQPASLGEPVIEPGWAEIGFGDWEGLTFAQVSEQDPTAVTSWLNDPGFAPPGGESVTEFSHRVGAQAEKTVLTHPGRTILVTAHAGVISALVVAAMGAELNSLWRIQIDPASLTLVQYWPGGSPRLIAVNGR